MQRVTYVSETIFSNICFHLWLWDQNLKSGKWEPRGIGDYHFWFSGANLLHREVVITFFGRCFWKFNLFCNDGLSVVSVGRGGSEPHGSVQWVLPLPPYGSFQCCEALSFVSSGHGGPTGSMDHFLTNKYFGQCFCKFNDPSDKVFVKREDIISDLFLK